MFQHAPKPASSSPPVREPARPAPVAVLQPCALPRAAFASIQLRPPSAVVQRVKGGKKNKKRSLRERVREKLSAGMNLSAREERVAPVRPTNEQLAAGRGNLARTDYGMVHPGLRGIRVRRDPGQSPENYTDLLADTRASARRLGDGPAGRQLLGELNAETAQVHPGQVDPDVAGVNWRTVADIRSGRGPAGAPLTVADIHSGRGLAADAGMRHVVRHDNTYPDVQRGYRYNGNSGAGIASQITYDESRPRPDRFISLGHELVHAHRAAHGRAVSPPDISPRHDDPLLNPPANPVIAGAIRHHAHLQEEFETVGLSPTPRIANPPTEAALRAEHGFRPRLDYSGHQPGGAQDAVLENVDRGTDKRGLFDKYWHKRPSKVAALIKHLED